MAPNLRSEPKRRAETRLKGTPSRPFRSAAAAYQLGLGHFLDDALELSRRNPHANGKSQAQKSPTSPSTRGVGVSGGFAGTDHDEIVLVHAVEPRTILKS
jgi:hypothetical protein